MNIAAIQRFAPLLQFASVNVGDMTDADLTLVANAIGGEGGAGVLVPLFSALRAKAPHLKTTQLLGSPEAGEILGRVTEMLETRAEKTNSTIFCQCPFCEQKYEQTIS